VWKNYLISLKYCNDFLFFSSSLTYPSNDEVSAARHNDDETSAVAESMPMRFTAVIMF
jgi:hypothetical protein